MKQFRLFESAEFRRKAIKLCKRNTTVRKKLSKALKQMEKDPFYGSLRTHKVEHSRYGTRYSSTASDDIRIIWDFVDENTIIVLLTIGGHEGKNAVYK
jgi:mRNA-degrading endonuclease RelE of RelBE toxin-antitoxin system